MKLNEKEELLLDAMQENINELFKYLSNKDSKVLAYIIECQVNKFKDLVEE